MLIAASLFFANVLENRSIWNNFVAIGWPLEAYSYFVTFGTHRFDGAALGTDLVISILMLAATGWSVERWARAGFRLSIASLLRVTAVGAALCSLQACGIVSLTYNPVSYWDTEFGQCVAVVCGGAIAGQPLTIKFYGATALEYVVYGPLFVAFGCMIYAAGHIAWRLMRLPLKILSPGGFRWRRADASPPSPDGAQDNSLGRKP